MEKLKAKLCFFALTIALLIMSIFSGFQKNIKVEARLDDDTTSFVSVGELFDSNTETFNKTNYAILKKYLTADSMCTIDDLATTIWVNNNIAGTDATTISKFPVKSGNISGVNYTKKDAGQDIVVKLGNLNWQVMYLSKDDNDNNILTLWLDNGYQEYWEDSVSSNWIEGCDGYSYKVHDLMKTGEYADEYPIGLYGTSLINAVTLNNGGYYLIVNEDGSVSVSEKVEKSATSPFALFTMLDYGLTDYLVTPKSVSWQKENQQTNAKITDTINGQGVWGWYSNQANENWSIGIDETCEVNVEVDDTTITKGIYFNSHGYHDDWADSYLWLPSVSEVFYPYMDPDCETNDDYINNYGIWKATRSQYHGNTLLRSLCNIRGDSPNCFIFGISDGDCIFNLAYQTLNTDVRPALHLNLSAIEATMPRSLITEDDLIHKEEVVTYTGGQWDFDPGVRIDGVTLEKGTDYTLTYLLGSDEISNYLCNAGTYTVRVTGIGYYSGVADTIFKITKRNIDDLKSLITLNPNSVVYTGDRIEPEINISKYNSNTLVSETDYTIDYPDDLTNAGTKQITIKGKGNYNGETSVSFNIEACPIGSVTISGIDSTYKYTGSDIKPNPTLTYNGKALVSGTDYTVEYPSDCVFKGSKTIKIKGKGNYTGDITKTYEIVKNEFSADEIDIDGIVDKDYNYGEAVTQNNIIVKCNGTVITTDGYSLSYRNNINAGEATLIITLKGSYSGSKEVTFKINKISPTVVVECGDDKIFEGNSIKLIVSHSSVQGSLTYDGTLKYLIGENSYNWVFTPNDTRNFNIVEGTIKITAIPLKILGINISGNYKGVYNTYEPFDSTGLVVKLNYNSGKVTLLKENEYQLSKQDGDLLRFGDIVTLTYNENTNITTNIPLIINRRVVSIKNKQELILTDGNEYNLSLEFDDEAEGFPVKYKVTYLYENESVEHILQTGNYGVKIESLDENYIIQDNKYDVTVRLKTIMSPDGIITLESTSGFMGDEFISYEIISDEAIALERLAMKSFDVDGLFLSMYIIELKENKNVTVKFKPDMESLANLNIYLFSKEKLTENKHTNVGNGYIAINCNSADKIVLFEGIYEKEPISVWGILLIILVAVIPIGFVSTYFIITKVKHKKTNKTLLETSEALLEDQESIDQSLIESLKDPSNLESSQEGINNTNKEDDINNKNSTSSNNGNQPFTISDADINNFNLSSEEIIKRYVIFDENKKPIAIKADAPESLKNAFVKFIQDSNNEK